MVIIEEYENKIAVARQLRPAIEEAGMNIAMRPNNIRKFKKSTNFPVIVYERRNFHDLGEWYVCVTAESRKRFLSGIVGICAFKTEKDFDGNFSDILLIEGDDDGNTFIEEFDRFFLDDYANIHNVDVDGDNYLPVFLKFYRENYFSTRKGLGCSFIHKDEEGKEHIVYPFIMATPVGVAMGITNDKREGNCYFMYESADKYFSDNDELLERVADDMLDYMNDMNNNPYKYSPLKNDL